jgi:hypothetical protein
MQLPEAQARDNSPLLVAFTPDTQAHTATISCLQGHRPWLWSIDERLSATRKVALRDRQQVLRNEDGIVVLLSN